MKSRIKMIIMALLICVCVVIPAVSLNAADESDSNSNDACVVVKYEDLEEVKDYLAGKNTYPTKEGYLFAGWYTTDDILGKSDAEVLKYAVRNSVPNEGSVYALFVPASVLDVKAQLSSELLKKEGFQSAEKGSIRFVTTVNSLLYQKVGFEVSYVNSNGAKKSATSSSNKVYDKLYAVGSTTDEYMENGEEYLPTEFSAASKFFKACNLKNIPASDFGVPITVKPFWVTLDGSKVYGETVIKSMDDYFLAEDVYVSNSNNVADKADAEGYGTEGKPYATLNYALSKVKNQGTVHIVETYATDADFNWEEHNKTVNIIGGELDFTTLPEVTLKEAVEATETPAVTAIALEIRDSVRFADITLNFADGQYVFANGNTLEIAESVVWGEPEAYITLVGGSHNTGVFKRDTNLILNKGQYKDIYGAGYYYCQLNGDVNITLGGSVNSNINYFLHEGAIHRLFGGGYYSAKMTGDINITIASEDVKFNYIYGAGRGSGTDVTGNVRVNFAGNAMSVYGGGTGTVKGDTYVTMTGGWAEQVFGGCSHVSMTGNTNVDIQGGEVERRVYGGCYNELSWLGEWQETYSVAGHTNVTISPKAIISYDCGGEDLSTYAISRGEAPFENEWGAFIFNETSYKDYESKLGHTDDTYDSKFSKQAYHYLITTNGNTEDGSLGTVSPDGAYIRIKPRRGYSAVVVDKETNKEYYTESEGVFKLPELTAKTDTRELIVTFSEISSSVDKSGYEARIDGAYYESFEEAVAATTVLDSKETVTVTVLQDLEVANQMDITSKVTIQNESGKDITIYRGTELATTDMFNVTSTGTLTLAGVEDSNSLVFDGRTKKEADNNTSLDDAFGSTGSLIKAAGNLNISNITIQYAKITGTADSDNGGAIYSTGADSKLSIVDSTFSYNKSSVRGGAIYAGDTRSKDITISGCIFEHNQATNAGGAICIGDQNVLNIVSSEFIGNTSDNFGGAVAMRNGSSTVNLSGKVTLDSNVAKTTGYGGGAIMTGSVLSIAENANITIKNNQTKGLGGGIYFNAGTTPKFVLGEGAVLTMSDNYSDKNGTVDIAIKDKAIKEGDKFVYGNNEEKTISEVAVGSVTYNVDVNGYLTRIVELIHEETTTTYASLQEAFEQAVDGDTIVLLDNITLKNQLTISKAVTLTTDGVADRTISCGSETIGDYIIDVTAAGKNVIFKGDSQDSKLIMDGTGVTLTKAFVHLEEATQITMENVTMQNIVKSGNDANGGAIYNQTPLFVKNCTFTNCSVTTDNTKNNGGAICSTNALTIEGSDFMGNKAGNRGGAIYTGADGTRIKDCTFGDGTDANKNSALNAGGAICVAGTTLTVNIENSTFKGNTAGYFGGAVAMTGSKATVNLDGTVTFDGNTAYTSETQFGSNTHGGGAVSTGKALNIADGAIITITNNEVENFGYGGGVYFQAGETPVFLLGEGASLTMSDNTDAKYGDADIVIPSGKVAAALSLNGSYAISSIYTTADTLITLGDAANDINPTITSITLIDGASGTSVAEGDQLVTGSTQADTIFTVVHGETEYALDNAGCLVAKGIALKHGDVTTRCTTLADAVQAAVDGDTIVVEKDVTLDTSLEIDTTVTITTDGAADRTIYCGAEAASGVVVSIAEDKEVTFKGATASSQLIFDGNEQSMKNVFVAASGEVTMKNVTMQNIITSGSYGAAVCITSPAIIENCSFINCSSTSTSANGGAIYVSATGAGTSFKGCIFTECGSAAVGGAICTKGSNLTVSDCHFTDCASTGTSNIDNSANNNGGGAIYAFNGLTDLTINDCTFKGNSASKRGGAIHSRSSMAITNCTFGDKNDYENNLNSSTDSGGAIHMNGAIQLDITGSEFYGNSAGNFGGAVSFSTANGATLNLKGSCAFKGNIAKGENADYHGGAIHASQYFYIHDDAVIDISGNYCTKFDECHAIGINYKASNPVLSIAESAKVYVYNNNANGAVDTSETDVANDICISNGTAFTVTGNYYRSAPTTE